MEGPASNNTTGQQKATLPRSGDVVLVSRAASVQFASPILFRVIRVHDWATYDGWVWLDGYELNSFGEAVERRSIFVQIDGLRALRPARTVDPRTRNARQPVRQVPRNRPVAPTRPHR